MQALADPEHAPSGLQTSAAPCRTTHQPARMASPGEYLSFCLGAESYGLALSCIQEIRSYQAPTHIANAPEEVCGVLNLRGTIVPVVDLRLRFQVATSVNSMTAIVVVNVREQAVGLVVDSVADVTPLTSDEIKPAPALGGRACTDHIIGIACVRRDDVERMLILLDIEQLVLDASVPSDVVDIACSAAGVAS
jgi:purine-binding chemotaxis protein CheW